MKTRDAPTTLTARDIMTPDPVCVGADTSARELARTLEAEEISGVPVLDASDRLIGVVSRTDLLRRCVEGPLGSAPESLFEVLAEGLSDDDLYHESVGTVRDMMSPEVLTAAPDEPVAGLARRMADHHVHRLVVINEKRHVVGIVTSIDVLKVFPAP